MKLSLTLGLAFPEIKDFYNVGFHGCPIGRIWLARDRDPAGQAWDWLISLPMILPDSSKGVASSRDEAMAALANELGKVIAATPGPRLQRAFDFALGLERKNPATARARSAPAPERPISEVLAELQIELRKQRQQDAAQPEPAPAALGPVPVQQEEPIAAPPARLAAKAIAAVVSQAAPSAAAASPVRAPAKPAPAAESISAALQKLNLAPEHAPPAQAAPTSAAPTPPPAAASVVANPAQRPPAKPVAQRAIKLNLSPPQGAPTRVVSKSATATDGALPQKAPAPTQVKGPAVGAGPPAAPSQTAVPAPATTASPSQKPQQKPVQATVQYSAKVKGQMNGAKYVVKRQPTLATPVQPNAPTKPAVAASGAALSPPDKQDASVGRQGEAAPANLPVKSTGGEAALARLEDRPPGPASAPVAPLPVHAAAPAEDPRSPRTRANADPDALALAGLAAPKRDTADLSDIETLLARHA